MGNRRSSSIIANPVAREEMNNANIRTKEYDYHSHIQLNSCCGDMVCNNAKQQPHNEMDGFCFSVFYDCKSNRAGEIT